MQHESFSFKRTTKDFEEYTLEGMDDPSDPSNGNKATLTLIDTVGYGECLNMDTWQKPILDYITTKVSHIYPC